MMYPDTETGASPMDLIPKGVNIVAIVQCGGLWFANGKFGCTWRLFQAVVQPKPSMKGKCLISLSSAAKSAMTTNTIASTDEVGVVVEDDSDEEQEQEPEPEVVREATPPAPVPAPAPVATPAPVKKKIVRKKEASS